MAVDAKAANPQEKVVKAAVNRALVVMAVVQGPTEVGKSMKPLCRVQSRLLDSRGTVFSED